MEIALQIVQDIAQAAIDSYLQVTVFVAAALLVFSLIDYKLQGGFVRWISGSKRLQPLIGALLGALPGCGGAIFLMPLYVKRQVTFGAVVSTLIATAGDSAFVLLAADFPAYLLVTAISMVVAVVTGYLVDLLGIGLKEDPAELLPKPSEHPHANEHHQDLASEQLHHIGHTEGDSIDVALHHKTKHPKQNSLGYMLTHRGFWLFWIFLGVGLIPGVMLLTGYSLGDGVGDQLWRLVGLVGTFLSVGLFLAGKQFLAATDHEEQEHKLYSLKESLIHSGGEVAFVGTWVFVAYLAYEILLQLVGGDAALADAMMSAGFTSVVVGAMIGLIPGCGPQVIFVTLFAKGMIPFSALLANAISQDGDALFPLIALHRPSAFKATMVTTIPALLVGGVVYLIEQLL